MYIQIIKRVAKRTSAPSLHKDSNLVVPSSPLRSYLRGLGRVMVWKRREVNESDSLFLSPQQLRSLWFLVDRIVNIC